MLGNKAELIPLRDLIERGGFAGYLLLFVNILSPVTYRRRDPELYATVDAAAVITILYVAVCFAYCVWFCVKPQGKHVLQVLSRQPIIFLSLYLFLCMLSTLWSPRVLYTGYRAFECITYLLLLTIVCVSLKQTCNNQDMVEWIVFWAGWVLLWNIVLRIKSQGIAGLADVGLFRDGSLTVGTVVFLAVFISKRFFISVPLLLFSLLSAANKTYFGIAFGIFPALAFGDRRAKKIFPFLLGVVIIAFLISGTGVIQNTLFYGREGIGWEYTSGRDDFWMYSFEQGMKKPYLGYGFVTGEKEALNSASRGYVISTHNVFLSAFLGVGILGPVLMVLFFVSLFLSTLKRGIPTNLRAGIIGTVIMAFVISSTAPGLGGRVGGSWQSVVFTSVFISILCKRSCRKWAKNLVRLSVTIPPNTQQRQY